MISEKDSILTFCLSFLSPNRGNERIISEDISIESKVEAQNLGEKYLNIKQQSDIRDIEDLKIWSQGEMDMLFGKNINNEKSLKLKESNEKSFKCAFDSCDKSFGYKWILDRHINSHFCFKLYKCEFDNCDKAYKSKENLNLHFKNKHLGEKPYQCRFCTSRFSHRNGKTYHERKVHINYLPHQCSNKDCNLSFASKSALNYHISNQH